MSRAATTWTFLAVLVMALSLGPSFAHVLEAPPRMTVWPPELWREATVFHGQFAWFALVGAPLDVGSILLGAAMTFVLRRRPPAFWLALAATVCYAASLATWLAVVAPMNAVLAQWEPGPVPETFEAVRNRWEAGHIGITAIKFVGLCCVIAGALSLGRQGAAQAERARR
jgi:H+/Cl- antiporter ClcA